MQGDVSDLALPPARGRLRRDELWMQTCFEAFLKAKDSVRYIEFNFAPNGDWAAYQFERYRQGGSDLDIAAPDIQMESRPDKLILTAAIGALPTDLLSGQIQMGPAAILQTHQDTRSYWALEHPADQADFHRPETFKINLE